MEKKKTISSPRSGMNRAAAPQLLSEQEYAIMINGNSYDSDGGKFTLTDELSNLLANRYKAGFKYVGGVNHVVRNNTYIFLTNPQTGVSEIGVIENTTDYTITEDQLETQTQTAHQTYTTLLEDSCNLCLGFNVDFPIIDIIIKEENIGTTMWWTSTPGDKEFRYLELDNIDQYKKTGNDNCGAEPADTCIDCDKLRVFKLYKELKPTNHSRSLGGNLKKGSYEILGAYCDILGNEFTSYTTLTPVIPIFDEANIIHEQADNNAETNFAIKIELTADNIIFDYYKITYRYYTSKGVFESKIQGVHGTSNTSVLLSDNNGESINNTTLNLVKPYVESVDGITDSNNILLLNGIKGRTPINLQPVISLAGLAMKWMSFRAKEDLYANADSYKYISYQRGENVAMAIDFGIDGGYRTNNFIFIPKPANASELELLVQNDEAGKPILPTGDNDIDSILNIVSGCDEIQRNQKWQFHNTAGEGTVCSANEDLETTIQTEDITTYTVVPTEEATSGLFKIGENYIIHTLIAGDNFLNVGYQSSGVIFEAIRETPTSWNNLTTVYNVSKGIPPIPQNQLTGVALGTTEEEFSIENFIEGNFNNPAQLGSIIAPYVDLANLNTINILPSAPSETCEDFLLEEEAISVDSVEGEQIVYIYPANFDSYQSIVEPNIETIYNTKGTNSEIDWDFSFSYASGREESSNTYPYHFVSYARKRQAANHNTSCRQAVELQRILDGNISNIYGNYYHQNKGSLTITGQQDNSIDMSAYTQGTVDSKDGIFTEYFHKNALWFETKVDKRTKFYLNLSSNSRCKRENITMSGYGFEYGKNKTTLVRVSIFASCASTAPIHSEIVDLRLFSFITIDSTIIDDLTSDKLYVAVETSIVETTGLGPDWEIDDLVRFEEETTTGGGAVAYNPVLQNGASLDDPSNTFVTTYISNLPCGAWNMVDRNEEASSVNISWDLIRLNKTQKYTTSCDFEIPILDNCKPVPYKYGELGFYQSTEQYPDNKELYDSSKLIITKSTITNTDLLDKLNLYKASETTTNITLSSEADFRCKNIRHYKLPDNRVSPFIQTSVTASNSDSIISPIGFTIDGEAINNLLDVAVENGLITQTVRNSIVDYKIYRSDSTLDRSIVGSGIVYNTKSYTVDGEKIEYFNYPYNSLGKDKYFPNNKDEDFNNIQVVSPEFDYFKPSLPDEMSIEGFQFGKSNNRILPVEEHAKMVILGDKAKRLASTLAIIEVVAEGLIAVAQSSEAYRLQFGFAFSLNPIGIGLNVAVAISQALGAVAFKVGRYRLQWLESFENLGTPYNFGYYLSSGSKYNYLKTLQTDGDRLRGLSVKKYLKSGMLNVSDTTQGNIIRLNNIDREDSPFFSLGNYPVENLNSEYVNFDNSDTSTNLSSQILSSEIGCHEGKSPEKSRNVASPYVSFKNYIPNQYGTIDSIRWIDTNYTIPIANTGLCQGILGGDTFISRHSKKRKVRMFETDLLGSADLTPFPYKFNSNYGDPKYYIDYKVDSEFSSGGTLFPDIFYDVKFDCNSTSKGFYVKPPGKFYLYSISFANFLCETRVNTNFRNARTQLKDQFYPQNTDYERITQPFNVPLTEPENFFYNKAYLQSNVQNTAFSLPEYYSAENEVKKAYNINTVMYSVTDANENSITEPWLLYRPNDRATLQSTYGNLIGLKGIESNQILMYFENALQLQNSVNEFTDGSTEYNSDLGNGGMFAKRPLTLRTTDIGYGGSQSKITLSNEFGHFHADMKRGQVFNYTGGQNLEEISRYSNGKPNGMDVWFKEHLPLKLAKKFPKLTETDNAYNGVGLHWGYDSKFRRILLTKKDYLPIDDCVEYVEGRGFVYNETTCGEIQSTNCPEGYTYNASNQKCEKTFTLINLCPEGYTYNQSAKTCTLIETVAAVFTTPEIGTITQPNCETITGIFQIADFDTRNTYTFTPAVLNISTTGLVTANPNTYNFTLTDIYDCVSLSSADIIVLQPETPVAVATPSSLTVSDGGTAVINLTSTTVGTTFTWTVVNSGTTGPVAGSGNQISQTVNGLGNTTYTITPTANGCIGNEITVLVEITSIEESCLRAVTEFNTATESCNSTQNTGITIYYYAENIGDIPSTGTILYANLEKTVTTGGGGYVKMSKNGVIFSANIQDSTGEIISVITICP